VLKNWLTKLTSTKRFENFKIYTEFEEDIGPVWEHRDVIWNKFSDLTKQMHDSLFKINEELNLRI
jgi:hypothetical protein